MKKTVLIVVGALIVGTIFFLQHPATSFAATNLLPNGNFEIADSSNSSRPQGWITGKWGTNTTTFSYPSPGVGGTRAVGITMSSRTSGDAKWTATPVTITAGKTYEYSDSYISDVTTHVTLEITLSDGTTQYPDVGHPSPSANWATARYQFTAPANAQSVRIFHLINQVGSLKIDNASLTEIVPTDPDNLIKNPSLEDEEATNKPQNWATGRWGTNATTFDFPVAGQSGVRAARTSVSSWSSGDAKWYFDDVPVTAGSAYQFSDYYKSTTQSFVTVRFKKTDGTFTFLDIGSRTPATNWTQFSAPFTVPVGTVSVTVFHLIRSVGSLDVDTFSLKKIVSDPTKFDKGYVSLNFDDGWLSVYENAIPILNAAGFKSDQYIVTDYLSDNYPGYVKPSLVLQMQSQGHSIGAHTRTHPNLTQLSLEQAQAEISGSRQDLLGIGSHPVSTFAYPFGAYNNSVKQIVQNTGFLGARSSDGGFNDKTQNIWALRRKSMEVTTTFEDIKGYIDSALTEKTWVILLFHEVNNSGHRYSVTPALLQQVVNYLKSKNVTPITVEEGIQKMTQ
ncbi:MAG: polysaccharide deacetylase family protein [Patescibacteria group bacterium]